MLSQTLGAVTVTAEPADEAAWQLVAATCAGALERIQADWGLAAPPDCRVHVMTAWRRFLFDTAPWHWRIPLVLSLPLWGPRARRTWQYAGGWTVRYGRRVAIGVKPPRLLLQSDRSIGAQVFAQEPDLDVKVRHITCHELTHACAAHLRLPAWLNEGLAMVTVDRYLQQQTVRDDSRDLVREFLPKTGAPDYRALARLDGRALAYHAARGYWLVRYLEEHHPGLVRGQLARRRNRRALEREIASALGMAPETFWRDVDGVISRAV